MFWQGTLFVNMPGVAAGPLGEVSAGWRKLPLLMECLAQGGLAVGRAGSMCSKQRRLALGSSLSLIVLLMQRPQQIDAEATAASAPCSCWMQPSAAGAAWHECAGAGCMV